MKTAKNILERTLREFFGTCHSEPSVKFTLSEDRMSEFVNLARQAIGR